MLSRIRIKQVLTFIIAMAIAINFMITPVFAAPNGVDAETPIEGEEATTEGTTEDFELALAVNEKLVDHEFNSSVFNAMVNVFMTPGATDNMFSEYANNSDIADKVLHAPLFSTVVTSTYSLGKSEFTRTDKELVNLTTDQPGELYSDFIKYKNPNINTKDSTKNSISWKSASMGSYKHYKNILVNAMIGDEGDTTKVISIDTYGNIIRNDLTVLVPFFMQNEFTASVIVNNTNLFDKTGLLEMKKDGTSIKSVQNATLIPFVPDKDTLKNMGTKSAITSFGSKKTFGEKTTGIQAFYISGVDASGNPIVTELAVKLGLKAGKGVSYAELVGWLGGTAATDINAAATKTFINYYEEIIRDVNSNFINRLVEHNEAIAKGEYKRTFSNAVFQGVTSFNLPGVSSDPTERLDQLLENLLVTLLTGGFGELLKLTVASIVADMYQELFIDFSSKYIFHTADYSESNTFNNLMGGYIVIVILLIIVNVLVSAISILRGKLTLGKVLVRILMIIAVTTLPIFLYNNIVNYGFNRSTGNITKSEIRQIMVLDRWLLLTKADAESTPAEELPFIINRDFRGTDYNYLISFNTDQFANEQGKDYFEDYYDGRGDTFDTDYDEELNMRKEASARKDNRVKLYVDANHLINYFNEGAEGQTLIEYLIGNPEISAFYPGLDSGLRVYQEYSYFSDPKRGVIDPKVFENGEITSSEIGKLMYQYYKDNEVNIIERFDTLSTYITKYDISNEKREQVIRRLSSVPSINVKNSYSSINVDDFKRERDYNSFLLEKELMEQSNYGDITGIYEFLKTISVVKGDDIIIPGVDGAILKSKSAVVKEMVYEINQAVIEDYLDTTNNLYNSMGSSMGNEILQQSVSDITLLNIYFELTSRLGNNLFPTDILASKVESDVYIRTLVVPFRDMTPNNISIQNAAMYVGFNKSIFTLAFFVAMILMVSIYGLIKMFVISTLLLPVLLALLVWNYIIKEDYSTKVIFGAVYILTVFILVHIGFMGVWKYCTLGMNKYMSVTIGGRASFFNTATNSMIICIYFMVTTRYMLYPTLKTAIKNPGDLGGSKQYDKVKSVGGRLVSSLAGGAAALAGMSTGVKSKASDMFGGKNKGTETTDTADKKKEDLSRDKNSADREKVKDNEDKVDDSIGKDIEDEINKKKNNGEDTTVTSKTGDGKLTLKPKKKLKDIFSKSDGEATSKEDESKKKEQLRRLSKYGKFAAKSSTEAVKGDSSNKLKFGSGVLAGSMGRMLSKKNIENTVDDTSVHTNATEGELKDLEGDMQKHVKTQTKELDKVVNSDIESTVGAHMVNRMTFDQNPDIDDQLELLQKSGTIQSYYEEEQEDGSVVTRVYSNTSSGLNEVETMIKEYGSEDIVESINREKVLRVNDNAATFEAMKTMGITDYSDVQENGQNFIDIASDANGKLPNDLGQELEVLGNDLNEVMDLKVTRNKYITLNAKNDIVEHYISDIDAIEGVDYIQQGDEYKSVTQNGYDALSQLGSEIEDIKESVKESYTNIGEVQISSSSEFVDTIRGQGLQHTISDLSYDTGEIMGSINEILSYKGNDPVVTNMKEVMDLMTDIKVSQEQLVMFTPQNIPQETVEKLVNNIQMYRKEKLDADRDDLIDNLVNGGGDKDAMNTLINQMQKDKGGN